MSIVNLIWACSSYKTQTVLATSEGKTRIVEEIPIEGPCRWLEIVDDTLLYYVQLGLAHGWQPVGTLLMEIKSLCFYALEPDMDIVESYNPLKLAEFKLVRGSDAAAWADALERGCAALEAGSAQSSPPRGERFLYEGMTRASFNRFNAPGLTELREFIAFLRQGPFKFYYKD